MGRDGKNLRSSMSHFYNLYAKGLSTKDVEVSFSDPYVYTTGEIGLTSVMPTFVNNEFIGVAGMDFYLSDLSNHLEYRKPTTNSYVFLTDRNGRAVVHPELAADPTSAPDRDIDTLEGAGFAESKIRDDLINRKEIRRTLTNVKRKLPRGSSTYEGLREVTQTLTYYTRRVEKTGFMIGLVVLGAPTPNTDQFSHKRPMGNSLPSCPSGSDDSFFPLPTGKCVVPRHYHRLDILYDQGIPASYAGVHRVSPNALVPYFRNDIVSFDWSTIKFSPSAFAKPADYLSKNESRSEILELTTLSTAGESNKLPGGGFLSSSTVIEEANWLGAVEPMWLNSSKRVDGKYNNTIFFYVGTTSGTFRLYPGRTTTLGGNPWLYDPTIRPWFNRALTNQDKFVLSTPYKDAFTGKQMVTLSVAIAEAKDGGVARGSTPIGESETVIAVMGADLTMDIFASLVASAWSSGASSCGSLVNGGTGKIVCYIVDSSGYVIMQNGMYDWTANSNLADENKFFAIYEAALAQVLIGRFKNAITVTPSFLKTNSRVFFDKQVFINYQKSERDTVYVVNPTVKSLSIEGQFTNENYETSEFYITPVRHTNTYLIAIESVPAVGRTPASCPSYSHCKDVEMPGHVDFTKTACEAEKTDADKIFGSLTCAAQHSIDLELMRGDMKCLTSIEGSKTVTIIVLIVGGLVGGLSCWALMKWREHCKGQAINRRPHNAQPSGRGGGEGGIQMHRNQFYQQPLAHNRSLQQATGDHNVSYQPSAPPPEYHQGYHHQNQHPTAIPVAVAYSTN